MKKLILLISLLIIFLTSANAQVKTKSDTAKKPVTEQKVKKYTLGFTVDSTQYAYMAQQLYKIFIHLDSSSAPHKDIQEDLKFLKLLYDTFEAEKAEIDKKK